MLSRGITKHCVPQQECQSKTNETAQEEGFDPKTRIAFSVAVVVVVSCDGRHHTCTTVWFEVINNSEKQSTQQHRIQELL